MDPLSITASLLSVIDAALRTTSALVKYARDAKNASSDRKLLAEETILLSKILQRLQDRAAKAHSSDTWLADHKDVVRQFQAAYDDLVITLRIDAVTGQIKQESKLKVTRTMLSWSFSKSELYSLLERITRLQQYANLLLVDDQHTLLERMDQKQQEGTKVRQRAYHMHLSNTLVHSARSETADLFVELVICSPNVLDSSGSFGTAFIYFKYNETERTFDNVLSSLLQQLLQDSEHIHPDLLSLYERHRDRNTSPTTDEISEALATMVDSHQEVSCVIDALDECEESLRWEPIEQLESYGPKLRVLITSQYLGSIAQELETYQRFEIRANQADIVLFIEHQIRKNRNLRKIIQRSPALRDDSKHRVFNTAKNMFLLAARLHVKSLASAAGLSVKQVRNKLGTLLSTFYDDAMERIENQEPDQ
ncbi:MAG: hypothetical protein Q9186_000319 [Xanthomendoza sp. 1 TL-2023]